MVCLSTWIVPTITLARVAEIIGRVLSVNLAANKTTKFDEYPGYEIDFYDEYKKSFTFYGANISLLGTPNDLPNLILKFPDDYSKKDENYCLTICSHNGLPLKIKDIFNLPYENEEEMKKDITRKLMDAGLKVSEEFPPMILGNEDI